MPQDQLPERGCARVVTMAHEPIEQLSIGKTAGGPGVKQRLDVAQDGDRRNTGHQAGSPAALSCAPIYRDVPGMVSGYPLFCALMSKHARFRQAGGDFS
jgi:hypothetical protein